MKLIPREGSVSVCGGISCPELLGGQLFVAGARLRISVSGNQFQLLIIQDGAHPAEVKQVGTRLSEQYRLGTSLSSKERCHEPNDECRAAMCQSVGSSCLWICSLLVNKQLPVVGNHHSSLCGSCSSTTAEFSTSDSLKLT